MRVHEQSEGRHNLIEVLSFQTSTGIRFYSVPVAIFVG